jgi:hypothetical protein
VTASAVLPALTALLAAIFFVALLDQWRERRHGYQLVWALGTLFYAIAAGSEALAEMGGWNEALYRTWYLTGAVWTAGWLGLGTAFLLGRTRFGYTVAVLLAFAGTITLLARNAYGDAGIVPLLYFIGALVLALAVGVATYFGDPRWPWFAAAAIVGASALSVALLVTSTLAVPGYALDPATHQPVATLFPAQLRLLTPFLNITGGLALALGAVFSTYVFMPKRRVLNYSLDPVQPGDQFLFNLVIAPVAITVNLVASLPEAVRTLASGRSHSRVPATILIAIGAFVPTVTDSLERIGTSQLFYLGKFLGVVFLLAGFLVSIEVFREIRVPFTGIRLVAARREHPRAARTGEAAEQTGPGDRPGPTANAGEGAAAAD